MLDAAFTASMHAGQGCAITTRLLVPRARYDEAVEAAAATMGSLSHGDPTDAGTICGPLISARQRDRVLGYLDRRSTRAASSPAAAASRRPRTASSSSRRVIADVDNNAKVAQEEIFGPVLVVIPHDGDDDAVRIANDSTYGLSGAVFSADLERAAGVAAGSAPAPSTSTAASGTRADMPFGGYKQSGIGREMGLAGFEEYLETKAIATGVSSSSVGLCHA